MTDLQLDPSLRDWVLLPILVVMILVGVIRHYATILLQTTPEMGDLKEIREQQFLRYGGTLRVNANWIAKQDFAARQTSLIDEFNKGKYLKDPEASKSNTVPNPLTDPKGVENMMNMMKSQIMLFVPQAIMMGWVNAFFAGFVLMRLPFPLTQRFKLMLQSGVDTPDLEARWVSSISWYFLNVLGLRSVYALILGDQNSAGGMAALGAPTAQPIQPGIDVSKLFKSEAENLELVKHEYYLDGIEDRFLGRPS